MVPQEWPPVMMKGWMTMAVMSSMMMVSMVLMNNWLRVIRWEIGVWMPWFPVMMKLAAVMFSRMMMLGRMMAVVDWLQMVVLGRVVAVVDWLPMVVMLGRVVPVVDWLPMVVVLGRVMPMDWLPMMVLGSVMLMNRRPMMMFSHMVVTTVMWYKELMWWSMFVWFKLVW